MAGVTLEQAQAALESCLSAQAKVLTKGQSYTVDTPNGQRIMSRADLGKIKDLIEYWQGQVAALTDAAAVAASGQVSRGRRTRSLAPG